jgi:hypothetical protein
MKLKNLAHLKLLKKIIAESIEEHITSLDMSNLTDSQRKWIEKAKHPDVEPFVMAILNSATPREVTKNLNLAVDSSVSGFGENQLSDGGFVWFADIRKEELKSMNVSTTRSQGDQRKDAILRIRDSSGRTKSRRWV